MTNYRFLFSLLIAFLVLSSCREDSLITDIEIIPPNPKQNIEATINGFILNELGEPIEDAEVNVANVATLTNELGFFEVTGLVDDRFAVVKVSKDGYFDQYQTLTPSKSRSAKNRTQIQLTERIVVGTFNSSSGGIVTIGNGSSVAFRENSFVDENNNIYSGQVNVYTHFIDPTDENINQIMPGNLMAVDEEDQLSVLQSFGMVNVELEGANGQALDINKEAILTVDVPASLKSSAPSEIPLWYFDETDGLWKEEGKASLINGRYEGTVNHFTFWNCDVPFDLTTVNGRIVDPRGPFFAIVRITDLSTGASFTSWTDSEGFFAGGVPQNTSLLLEVLGFCDEEEILFSTTIGPFDTETADLGSFNISNDFTFSLVSGTLVDCNQNPIPNGEVYFKLVGSSYIQEATTDASGNFSELVPVCEGEELEIRGRNPIDGLVSQVFTVTSDGSNTIEAGDINVCTNASGSLGSVTLNFNGEEKVFDNCTLTLTDNGANKSYLFTYFEALPPVGDSIVYYFILESTNDINWSALPIFYGPPASAANSLYYTYTPSFQTGSTNVTVIETAELIGELTELTLTNISINRRINDPDGPNVLEKFPGSSMTISAVLQ